MNRIAVLLLAGGAFCLAAPAHAGEEPLYEPAPAWVEETRLPEKTSGPPVLVFDDQRRIEEGQLWAYSDRAIRIDNPQMLQAVGTLQATWQPDKGDLIVHRIAIIRNGEVIDALAGGQRFEVLRRERQLENRMLDGMLTATLPVAGLRVGDIIRLTYSTTLADQALDKEVQTFAFLPSENFEAGLARVRVSWPEDADVHWHTTRDVKVPAPVTAQGYSTIEVKLPLGKMPEMPGDAPVRYRMPPMLQVGTFADWQEVSRRVAPLFATEGTIAPDGPIAHEIARIETASPDPLDRAVAALRLVQDEIAYMLRGMDGGNYIPQQPSETWHLRYGDCKAKTMLLLAMLREMNIEAEAVLVASATGDALPDLLPMPADFDHVLVRATIAGRDYWLDGTSTGASLAVVQNVPGFHHALPLRAEGAALMRIENRPQEEFDVVTTMTLDQRAGLDVPTLFEVEWSLRGPAAAPIRGLIGQVSEDRLDDFVDEFVANRLSDATVLERKVVFDEASRSALVRASGITYSPWEWERGRGTYALPLPSAGFQFGPDRSRSAWRSIPVAIPGPYAERLDLTVKLADAGEEYVLEGPAAFTQEIATVRMTRSASVAGSQLQAIDTINYPGGELPADVALQQRSLATRAGSTELRLQAPKGIARYFDAITPADRKRFAPIESVYAALIRREPDNASFLRGRAWFRSLIFDRSGAVADLDKLIDLEPSAQDYLDRAAQLVELNRMEPALADAEAAWELDPTIDALITRANILGYLGRPDDAIAVLEGQGGDAVDRRKVEMAISDLEALAGRADEGLQRLDSLLAQRPGDPEMLNAKCWYQATWNVQPEGLEQLCTEAVESADWSPPVLDSRAMGYFRLGRLQEALNDLDAALLASPDLTPSLYMRGIVRQQLGDMKGKSDIAAALVRQPSLERFYARFGIKP